MKRIDLWGGIFLLVVSAFVMAESIRMGIGSFAIPGAGFLTFGSGFLLAFFSVILIVLDIKKGSSNQMLNVFENVRWKGWLVMLASMVFYLLMLEILGFMLCTFIFMVILLVFVEPLRWTTVLLIATITTLSSYLLFQTVLKTQIPAGILGF